MHLYYYASARTHENVERTAQTLREHGHKVDVLTDAVRYLKRYVKENSKQERGGGVRAPVYGIVIKRPIRQLAEATRISVVCLPHREFMNVFWSLWPASTAPQKDTTYLGTAMSHCNAVYLNASKFVELTQAGVNFVCLHELAHVIFNTDDERDTDEAAIELARHIGVPIPPTNPRTGLVVHVSRDGYIFRGRTTS